MTQNQADRVYKKLRLLKDGSNTIEETLDDLIKEFSSQENDDAPMSKTKRKLLANNDGCCQTLFVQPTVRCVGRTFNMGLTVMAAIFIGFLSIRLIAFLSQVST